MNSASIDTMILKKIQLLLVIFNIFNNPASAYTSSFFHRFSFNLQYKIASSIPLPSDTIFIKFLPDTF